MSPAPKRFPSVLVLVLILAACHNDSAGKPGARSGGQQVDWPPPALTEPGTAPPPLPSQGSSQPPPLPSQGSAQPPALPSQANRQPPPLPAQGRQPAPPLPVATGRSERTAQAERGFQDGRDYTIWRRVRLVDQHGFGTPVEAMSYMIPEGWRLEGGIRWTNDLCVAHALHNRATISASDNWFRLEIFPNAGFEHTDDPNILRLGSPTGFANCPLVGVFSAEEYVRQVLVPQFMPGARVVSVGRNAEVERTLTPMFQRQLAGMGAQVEIMAIEAELDYGGGDIGQLLALGMRAIEQGMGVMGGFATSGYTVISEQHASRYPASRREEGEEHFVNILNSRRKNPEWDQAVQKVISQTTMDAIKGARQRSEINFETSREIGQMSMRNWENRMASNERGVQQFSQAMRGVETWESGDGQQLELMGGYNEAWSRGDGTYILSNDPHFDPRRVYQENWERMQRPRE